jgi:hypothetical protein
MGDNPRYGPSLLQQSAVSRAAAVGIMSYGGLYGIVTYLMMLFQTFKDVSPLMASPLRLLV